MIGKCEGGYLSDVFDVDVGWYVIWPHASSPADNVRPEGLTLPAVSSWWSYECITASRFSCLWDGCRWFADWLLGWGRWFAGWLMGWRRWFAIWLLGRCRWFAGWLMGCCRWFMGWLMGRLMVILLFLCNFCCYSFVISAIVYLLFICISSGIRGTPHSCPDKILTNGANSKMLVKE